MSETQDQTDLQACYDKWTEWYNGSIPKSVDEEREKFYIATAINYTNGEPHLGMFNTQHVG